MIEEQKKWKVKEEESGSIFHGGKGAIKGIALYGASQSVAAFPSDYCSMKVLRR
jgi:hypothetical protein